MRDVISSDFTPERVLGSGIFVGISFPLAYPTGEDFMRDLVKFVKTPLKKTLVKAMLTDRKRNEDNTYSSRGTNKQSSLDAFQRRESVPLPLTPAVIIIGRPS